VLDQAARGVPEKSRREKKKAQQHHLIIMRGENFVARKAGQNMNREKARRQSGNAYSEGKRFTRVRKKRQGELFVLVFLQKRSQ